MAAARPGADTRDMVTDTSEPARQLSSWTPLLRRRSTPWFLYAGVVALAVVATLAVGAATATEQAADPPTCFGLGWGCEPDPASVMAFFALLLAGPYVVVSGAALAVSELAGERFATARSVGVLVVLAVGALATGVVVVAAARGL